MSTLREIGEFGFIESIRKTVPQGAGVIQGIGDDCAVLALGGGTLLVSCDACIEDIHFSRDLATPEQIGWKCAAAAISDIAAMGGRPRYLVVALACPQDTRTEFLDGLFAGIQAAASHCGVSLVGGDTTRSPQALMLDFTVMGEPAGARWLGRSGAQPGDLLCVSGAPGCSAAGLFALQAKIDAPLLADAHLRPQPRIAEGQWLAAQDSVHAMIDLSDGLVQDAGRLADASGIGLDFLPEQLVVSPALESFRQVQGIELVDLMMTGGEDYELIVAVASEAQVALSRAFEERFQLPLAPVGRFCDSWQGVRIEGEDASRLGYDHFRD